MRSIICILAVALVACSPPPPFKFSSKVKLRRDIAQIEVRNDTAGAPIRDIVVAVSQAGKQSGWTLIRRYGPMVLRSKETVTLSLSVAADAARVKVEVTKAGVAGSLSESETERPGG